METICTAEITANCQNVSEAARSLLNLIQTTLDSQVDANNFAKVITNLASSLSSLDKDSLINVSNNAVAAISNMVENARSSLVTSGARGNNTNAIKSMIDSLQTSLGAKVESGEVISVVTNVIKAALKNGGLQATVTETIVFRGSSKRKRREATSRVDVNIPDIAVTSGKVVSIVAYEDDTLFQTPDQLQISAGQDVQLIFTLLSKIVSIKINNTVDSVLKRPIEIKFNINKTVNTNGTTLCRYWNSTEATWKTNDVKTSMDVDHAICYASIFSDFGVVHKADPTQAPTLPTTTTAITTTITTTTTTTMHSYVTNVTKIPISETTTTKCHAKYTTSTPQTLTVQKFSYGKTIFLVNNGLLIILLFVSMVIVLRK